MNVQSHEFFPLVKMKRKIQQTMEQAYTVRDWLNRVGGWVVRRQAVGRGSGAMGYGSWVVGRICLKLKKEYKYIYAPSVLGPNLQMPAHELISPNSFYEKLNKGKLSH